MHKRRIQFAVSLLIAAAIIWYLFRDVDWALLWSHTRSASIGWLLLGQVPIWLSFAGRIQRWKYIVRSAHPEARWRGMFSATQIGFLANFVLPARAGELIRPYVLTRLEGVPFTKGLAMTALDRVTDLVGLLAVLLVTMIGFRPPADVQIPREVLRTEEPIVVPVALIQQGATVLTLALVALIASLAVLYANQRLVARISDAILGVISRRLAGHVHGMIVNFSEGLHIFRRGRDMLRSVMWSLATWGCFLVSSVCMLNAFGLEYAWYAPWVLQAMIAVGIGVPVSPGFVGQFQVSVMMGLILAVPGIGYEQALAIGLVTHVLNFLPVLIAGVGCLLLEDMSLKRLKEDTEMLQEEQQELGPPGTSP